MQPVSFPPRAWLCARSPGCLAAPRFPCAGPRWHTAGIPVVFWLPSLRAAAPIDCGYQPRLCQAACFPSCLSVTASALPPTQGHRNRTVLYTPAFFVPTCMSQ